MPMFQQFTAQGRVITYREHTARKTQVITYKMKAGKAHGFNRGMIGRQSRFSWNKIRAKEFHCVSSGRNWRIIFLRSECVQTVNKTLFGLFLH